MVDDGTNCSPRMTFCHNLSQPDVVEVTHPDINEISAVREAEQASEVNEDEAAGV